jgi:hypothetical protein
VGGIIQESRAALSRYTRAASSESAFIEYDYYNFGTRDVSFIAPVSHVDIRETNNVVKAGLNFRFGNWGGGVARY